MVHINNTPLKSTATAADVATSKKGWLPVRGEWIRIGGGSTPRTEKWEGVEICTNLRLLVMSGDKLQLEIHYK